jgi:hypothetical protein
MIISFGKHKGKRLDELPQSYLRWLVKECSSLSPHMRDEIEKLLGGEKSSATGLVPQIVGDWYRQLAREFHPDKGGSHEAMKAVNRGRDLLLQLAGVAR